MKYFAYIFVFSILLISAQTKADIGCNTGNQIYTISTGGTNSTGYPTYYNSPPINIRWWDQDSNCGILSTKISMKSNAMDYCQIGSTATWGIRYNYNPADNSCHVPLDDNIWLLFFGMAGLGILRSYRLN